MELLAQASLAAINDAGLKIADIDAVFSMLPDDPWCAMSVPEYLGIRPKLIESTRTGGSSFQIHALWAALALDAGLCDAVLVCYGSNQRSSSGGFATSGGTEFGYESVYKPRNPPTSYALAAARHMHEFGTTREQLAEVAVAARRWAQLNPDAFARDDLTIRDCLEARMVSDPLTVRDCCLVTDGAAALVMTRADRARDIRHPPVYLLGAASAVWHRNISAAPDLTITAVAECAPRAFAQAGVKASDVDVVEIYDAFTINTILFLEDFGFCPKAKAVVSSRAERSHRAAGWRLIPMAEGSRVFIRECMACSRWSRRSLSCAARPAAAKLLGPTSLLRMVMAVFCRARP